MNIYYTLRKDFDHRDQRVLYHDEFERFLAQIGLFVTNQEMRTLRNVYADPENQDRICYYNFFQDLKYQFSDRRAEVIRRAWSYLTGGSDNAVIDLEQLKAKYIPSNHLRVKTKEKTEEEVFDDFWNTIVKKSDDGQTINSQQFTKYYADVNAVLPSEKEDYFINLVINTWGLTTGDEYVSPERIQEIQNIFFEKIR